MFSLIKSTNKCKNARRTKLHNECCLRKIMRRLNLTDCLLWNICATPIIISLLYISKAVNSIILTGPVGGNTVVTHSLSKNPGCQWYQMFWLQKGYRKRGCSELLESRALLGLHKILEALIFAYPESKWSTCCPERQYVQYFQAHWIWACILLWRPLVRLWRVVSGPWQTVCQAWCSSQ